VAADEPQLPRPAGGSYRASDAEREEVVERLRVATTEGRLTLTELTERTEAAYTSTTHAELAEITADLPSPGAGATWAVPAAPVTPVTAPSPVERISAVMGESKRSGRWRVDRPISAVCVMGEVEIDLRGAEVPLGFVDITATVIMGDIKIIVPDGVDVQLSGTTIMGDKSVKVEEAPPGRRVPVVRVQATVFMGDLKIINDTWASRPRRSLMAWIRREDPKPVEGNGPKGISGR
jgi:hypothetical protein